MRKLFLTLQIIILSSLLWTFVFAGKFYLEPREITITENCPFEAKLMIDTRKQPITAVDMSLRYDDEILDVKWFIPSNMFSVYRWLKKDHNKLRLTAVQYPWFVKEKNEFGTLILEAKKNNKTTKIQFEVDWFWPDSTLDTNLAFKWKDYLTEVWNLLINIQSWECDFDFEDELTWFVEYDTGITYQEFEDKRAEKIDSQYVKYNGQQEDDWRIHYEFDYIFLVFVAFMLLLIVIVRYRKKQK